MKKNKLMLPLATFAMIFLTNCQVSKKDIVELNDSKISLIAPNKETIAPNITSLEKWASDIFKEKFKTTAECKITEVKYYDVKQGYVAHIYYETSDGKNLSYLLTNNKVNIETSILIYNSKLQTRDDGCNKWVISCSGGTCCTPSFNVQTNTASCPCMNSNGTINTGTTCTLSATCSEQ